MLRTALIGFPSSGKTTLFQLMTSHHEAPKAGHGKLEAVVGVARVPDVRVDRLAELY
jgi:ribosome-binding ATPase